MLRRVSPLLSITIFVAGIIAGAIAVMLVERKLHEARVAKAVADANARANTVHSELSARLAAQTARLEAEEAGFTARLDEISRVHEQLKAAFQALSADALKSNNEQFLQLARTELERVRLTARAELSEKETAIQGLVTPIRETLEKTEKKLGDLERARAESFATLSERIEHVVTASADLRTETNNLSRALRSSNVRGAWGELQLKRAVELAGMLEHCDFTTQHSVDSDGGQLRPDMVVHLPGQKTIVVDAKTPATAVLEAVNCQDDARRAQLCQEHVVTVKNHINALSKKSYWEQFDSAPEFVVMFLPSEAFFSVALEFDPALFEHAFEQSVIIATPTTLVALLKAVAFGWRQEAIALNAQEISALGRELYDRIRTLADHFEKIGDHLAKAVGAFNGAVGSLERRVLPQARRFHELGVGSTKEMTELSALDVAPVPLTADELKLPLLAPGEA
jgi:DNA recombination protein RmuC